MAREEELLLAGSPFTSCSVRETEDGGGVAVSGTSCLEEVLRLTATDRTNQNLRNLSHTCWIKLVDDKIHLLFGPLEDFK